jgi:large subunit ribosomal protein L23
MRDIYSIIQSPVVTEKSMANSAEGNNVVFWVDPEANKGDIKEAIQKIFDVKVISVNTQRLAGKIKKQGRFAGRRPTRKKAYVKLKEGDSIELFEGA